MSAKFSFEVDPARDLVRIRMRGFFEHDDLHAFLEARRRAHLALDCPPNMHVTLNDLRDMKIQAQEIVDAFRAMLSAPHFRSRRLAFVVGSTLAKAQVMRALLGREARCFDDLASAEAWLFADEEEEERAPVRARRAAG